MIPSLALNAGGKKGKEKGLPLNTVSTDSLSPAQVLLGITFRFGAWTYSEDREYFEKFKA